MQTADFNHNDFKDTSDADKALLVKFFYKNVENKLESTAAGRPIFKEKTYIEIRLPGQRGVQACRPVTHADKMRFPKHFEAFEARMEPPTEGTPLTEWPQISRTQAEELSFLHIKTVEQLATVKDVNIQKFMGGYTLREKAVKWLDLNEKEVDNREKADMQTDIDELKAKLAALLGESSKGINAKEEVERRLNDHEEGEKIAANVRKNNAVLANVTSPAAEEAKLQSVLDKELDENADVKAPAAPAAKKRRR
jgi:hypothetical protein